MFLGPAALILETIRLCNASEWLGSTLYDYFPLKPMPFWGHLKTWPMMNFP